MAGAGKSTPAANASSATLGDQTGIDATTTAVAAAAAAGAAQGAEMANHFGISEEQFVRLSGLTMNAAAQAAAKASNDAIQQRRRADRLKDAGKTAAISAGVFVVGTVAVAGYNRYYNNGNRNDGNNRGRNEG